MYGGWDEWGWRVRERGVEVHGRAVPGAGPEHAWNCGGEEVPVGAEAADGVCEVVLAGLWGVDGALSYTVSFGFEIIEVGVLERDVLGGRWTCRSCLRRPARMAGCRGWGILVLRELV